jgi:ABC-2 type transport system permease protein
MNRIAFQRMFAVVLRQYYLMRGSFSRVSPMFIWVLIDMILWGFITKYLNSVSAAGFNFIPVLLGAALLWDFFGRVMQGVTMTFFEDVWSRNFLNIFATPLSIAEYLSGLVFCSIAMSSVSLVLMVALAALIFGLSFLSYGMVMVPFLMILFLFGIALGILACAMVLRFGPSAEWFVWPIPMVLSPFAAVFYPLSTLPKWMQMLAHLLAPSYVFEGLRAVTKGTPVSLGGLGWGGGLSVCYVLAACVLFMRVYKQALRSGLIARYSAESVS